jgi:hypothetical protein
VRVDLALSFLALLVITVVAFFGLVAVIESVSVAVGLGREATIGIAAFGGILLDDLILGPILDELLEGLEEQGSDPI